MRRSGLAAIAAAIIVAAVFIGRETRLAAQPAERDAGGVLPAAGAACVVYLRGDAAGMSYHDRIADLGNLIVRRGTVVRADDTWLVLKDGDHQSYIPRTSIMLIEVGK